MFEVQSFMLQDRSKTLERQLDLLFGTIGDCAIWSNPHLACDKDRHMVDTLNSSLCDSMNLSACRTLLGAVVLNMVATLRHWLDAIPVYKILVTPLGAS